MAVSIRPSRGTRAAFDALVSGNALVPGQMYAITNEGWIAVATGTNTYSRTGGTSVQSGTGITVNAADPVNPVVGLSIGTQASLTLANTAVQPDDLAGFATTAELAGKFDTPTGTTGQYLRGDGSAATFPSIHNIPAGGTTGQVLKKTSGTDYDVEWDDESGGGGGGFPPDINAVGDIVLAYVNNPSPGNVVRGGTVAATYLTPIAFTQTGVWLAPKASTALTTGTYMNIGGGLEGASNLTSIWRRVA